MKSNRKLRFGGYATLLTLLVIAALIGLNLLVDQIPLRLDLTRNKVYSLSEQTLGVLLGLKSEVTISHLLKSGSEDPQIREVLRRYDISSPRILLDTIDPERNPGWARQHDPAGAGLREGTLVVASADRFKVIERADMYSFSYQDPEAPPTITALALEQRLTSAILYVTTLRNPLLYVLQGHGEDTLAELGIQHALENENYDVKELNLLTLPGVPADADLVAVINPKNDLTGPDLDKLDEYLTRGGRALVACDPRPLPNLYQLLAGYGLAFRPMLIVEGSSRRHTGNPLFLLPELHLHDITRPLRANDIPLVLPLSQAVEILPLKKRSLLHEPLAQSSPDSWGKLRYLDIRTMEKESGDAGGPFALAVAVSDPSDEGRPQDTRLLVFGSYRFLTQPFFSLTPGNSDFFINGVNWLNGREESLTIRPKELVQYPLTLNRTLRLLYTAIVVILMPLAVLLAGLVVWLRRRHL